MAKRQSVVFVIAVSVSVVAASCSSNDKRAATPTPALSSGIAATVASYELLAAKPQRFIVGLLRADQKQVVSFGTVNLAFAYLGTKDAPQQSGTVSFTATGRFMPIPGQHVDPAAPGPRLVDGSEGTGVYGADGVTFDKPGYWGVNVSAVIGGRRRVAQANFEVVSKNRIPGPGDAAPRTDNAIAGAAGLSPRSIDSRADDKTAIPDPELHSVSIATAIAQRRPLMVVVSTPSYCISRFCGPITDSVQALAKRYGDRMAFVHLEVWKDFDAGVMNPAAAEWINPDKSADAMEPWTFVVGADGIIKQRFDNVATDQELADAVAQLVGAS